MDTAFTFKKSQKIVFGILIAIGIVSLAIGIFSPSVNSHRVWANVLLNNFYMLAFALAGVFFVAVHSVAESGWQTSIQRIPEAMGSYLPVAAITMLLLLVGMGEIYHWTDPEHLDKILEGKKAYLNVPFFIIRLVVYFTGWILLARKLRQLSLQNDLNPDIANFHSTRKFAAIFLVFFAVTSSTSAWDWLMSIDAHWFSTLYGWYIFSGLLVSGIAVIILLIVFLRKQGYIKHVNEEHMHDLGKYLFGFSIFWTYLWFSQFMLIWYGNIPEETVYFVERMEHYKVLFFTNLGLNFVAPFLILMTRGSKRKMSIMVIASVIVIIGHWLDLYLAIMPGAVGYEHAGIGIVEIGTTLGYMGLFLFFVFRGLTKASLAPKNHPFFKESLEYDNIGG